MRTANVVEINSGDAVECSRRILRALQTKNQRALKGELLRAERVCQRPGKSTLAAEQSELLLAVVRNMPWAQVEISLLGHLSDSTSRRNLSRHDLSRHA